MARGACWESRIAIRTGWSDVLRKGSPSVANPRDTELTVDYLISVECQVAAGQATQLIMERLERRADADQILSDLAFDLSSALRHALDMMAILNRANVDHDASFIDHPSIAPHEQNHFLHGWSHLIEC